MTEEDGDRILISYTNHLTTNMRQAKLINECEENCPTSRLLGEKTFGNPVESTANRSKTRNLNIIIPKHVRSRADWFTMAMNYPTLRAHTFTVITAPVIFGP